MEGERNIWAVGHKRAERRDTPAQLITARKQRERDYERQKSCY